MYKTPSNPVLCRYSRKEKGCSSWEAAKEEKEKGTTAVEEKQLTQWNKKKGVQERAGRNWWVRTGRCRNGRASRNIKKRGQQ